jgi:uncharacterized protein (DUF2147 family)
MKRFLFLFISIFLCISTMPSFGMEPASITGLWLNQEKSAQVEIYESTGRIYGKIVSLKEPVYPPDDPLGMAGRPKIDRNNPDPLKRKRPLVGLLILDAFRRTGDRTWEDGFIYDPKNGKTYRCKMTLDTPNTLFVRGFIGFSLLGRTTTWTRGK